MYRGTAEQLGSEVKCVLVLCLCGLFFCGLTSSSKCHVQHTVIAYACQPVFVFRGDIKLQTKAVDEPDVSTLFIAGLEGQTLMACQRSNVTNLTLR